MTPNVYSQASEAVFGRGAAPMEETPTERRLAERYEKFASQAEEAGDWLNVLRNQHSAATLWLAVCRNEAVGPAYRKAAEALRALAATADRLAADADKAGTKSEGQG
jgi:hypothetical protein